MPNIGPLELAVVVIIAIVILGPKKFPEVGRSVGQGIREFKGSISGKAQATKQSSTNARPPSIEEPVLDGEVVEDPKA